MNYPNACKSAYEKNITYSNRGMDLEYLINKSNEYYLENDIALIHKKPTPIGIDKVEYKPKPIIKNAYFKEPSTLDYNGLYKGKYIDFDAKVTKSKTAFPLSNIHLHQIEHIRKVISHGGITFLLIMMNDCVYLLTGNKLIDFIDNYTRKSITYEYIIKNAYLIKYGINPPINYIKVIDKIIEGE